MPLKDRRSSSSPRPIPLDEPNLLLRIPHERSILGAIVHVEDLCAALVLRVHLVVVFAERNRSDSLEVDVAVVFALSQPRVEDADARDHNGVPWVLLRFRLGLRVRRGVLFRVGHGAGEFVDVDPDFPISQFGERTDALDIFVFTHFRLVLFLGGGIFSLLGFLVVSRN
ncbi:hypothetical protein HG530_005807 [Fusarium avenaceum]|nr:hypothetical protein HG530_005807 [Fusarium avenaceum]